jgi:hypothetical protein
VEVGAEARVVGPRKVRKLGQKLGKKLVKKLGKKPKTHP